jgi:DNA (cytosine-5)-methyltransferase 1
MRYLSVCAGIEAATVAWHPLGWTPAAFSEIEPFPRAVLRHHWPHVPIHGRDRLKGESFEDHAAVAGFQTIGPDDYGPIDLLVGGTPCQSFSIAGKRGGMADGRGNLALEYIRLADRKRARWVVWENVPGVFSSNGGEDFRCFLSGLVRWDVPIPDGGWRNAGVIAAGPADGAFGVAWRVLDAQFAGVPQRRRRVFVVGHLGDWRRAAAVLFERHSLSGHPAPRREAGQNIANAITERPDRGGGNSEGQRLIPQGYGGETAPTLNAAFGSKLGLDNQHIDSGAGLFVAHSLRAEGFDASEDGTGRGTPLVPVAIQERAVSENPAAGPQGKGFHEGVAYTLEARNKVQSVAYSIMPMNSGKDYKARETDVAQPIMAGGPVGGNQGGDYIAFTCKDYGNDAQEGLPPTPRSGSHYGANGGVMPAITLAAAVRRLTPRECERLQGFPDDHTRIAWSGWRDMDEGETPESCREEGLEVKQTKGGKWRVRDIDGPRYKSLGNSMAVPVMRWIGERIQAVEDLRLNGAPPLEDAA